MKNVCICVPARYNSSRLSGKLMLELGGKTCLQRTIEQILPLKIPIYILTDHLIIYDHVTSVFGNTINVIKTTNHCLNGTERISKHLHLIPSHYDVIINVQADEPFINSKNVAFALHKYLEIYENIPKLFYVTLHEVLNPSNKVDLKYLNSTSCLKVTTTSSGKVLTYSRNIIPWNKKGHVNNDIDYKIFTGIYIFNRDLLNLYHDISNTYQQLEEDVEQLKILENDYLIYSFPTLEFNEISLNDQEDFNYLCEKYKLSSTITSVITSVLKKI
jgi:3-deoxy-manno-octulosonate cytidylyltransferase (CMP-KDO synthetase)